MKWMERLENDSLKRLFVISLATSIVCNATISYLMSISGTSLPKYFKVMFSLDVPLIRGYIDNLQGPGAKTWFTILYGVDYVFFTALGLMIFSASTLIHRNEKAFGVMSKLGKSFAFVGILEIAVDFLESGLAVYMFSSAQTYPDWMVVPHSILFILAIVVDGIAGLFLLTSLFASIVRKAKSVREKLVYRQVPMKNTLYYFTGTGNSLWLTKQMQKHIPECEIKSIPQTVEGGQFAIQGERVGIVTPLYFYGLPEIVLRFIKQGDLSTAKYTFIVVTHGGPPFVEGGIIEQTESLMAEKGMRLDASFMQWMPGNFILWYGAFPGFVHNLQLKHAKRRARKIAQIVSNGGSRRERGNPWVTKTIAQREYPKWLNSLSAADEGFWTTDACNACGICEKVCPVKNVRLQNGTPQWQHTCQQCMACIQYCPKEAVQYKEVTRNRRRYHNPHIRVSEIVRQNPKLPPTTHSCKSNKTV